MKKLNESYLEIKKSKFIGLLYEVNSINEVEEILNEIKINNKKARHVVYAYKINGQEKNYSDKEPGGTTRGLLDILHIKNENNKLVIVIRYFGGILLGSGPLTRTYTKISAMLFDKK